MNQDITAISEMAADRNRKRAGTLVYTTTGLLSLFLWLLWGDFCYTLMEQVVPQLVPLSLKDQHASNTMIGFIVGTLPHGMSIVLGPAIGSWSDRHRGPRGRRIPFLLWPTPFVALFLIVVGFAEPIGHWIHTALGGRFSAQTLVIAAIACGSVLFQFFNLFVTSIYFCLFNDVVPLAYMGRFFGCFRVIGAMAAFVWSRYIFGIAGQHRPMVYLVIAIIYVIAFMLMCWRVKEGEYPPPEKLTNRGDLLARAWKYARECFGHPLLLSLYGARFFYSASAACQNTFAVFMANGVGMSLDDFGKTMGWVWVIAAAVSIPLGYITDRLRPSRTVAISVAQIGLTMLVAWFVVQGSTSFLIVTLIWTTGRAVYEVAIYPLQSAALPREKFGQFSSAHGICSAAGYALGSVLAGLAIDSFQSYRLIYIWSATCMASSFVLTLIVHFILCKQSRDMTVQLAPVQN